MGLFHNNFVQGALMKGWGGVECYNTIPLSTHITESLGWIFLCAWFQKKTRGFKWYENLKSNISKSLTEYEKSNPKGNPLRFLEILVGSLHVLMFFQIIYYKSNISALIYLLQPCHLILLVQGIALLSNGLTGVLISLFILPALTGTTLAMIFPETTGLDQPLEMEAYWLQHILIEAVPIYLLVRKDGLALQYANYKAIVAGLWLLTLLHFVLLEVRNESYRISHLPSFFIVVSHLPLRLST